MPTLATADTDEYIYTECVVLTDTFGTTLLSWKTEIGG